MILHNYLLNVFMHNPDIFKYVIGSRYCFASIRKLDRDEIIIDPRGTEVLGNAGSYLAKEITEDGKMVINVTSDEYRPWFLTQEQYDTFTTQIEGRKHYVLNPCMRHVFLATKPLILNDVRFPENTLFDLTEAYNTLVTLPEDGDKSYCFYNKQNERLTYSQLLNDLDSCVRTPKHG